MGKIDNGSLYFEKDAFVEKFRPLTYYEIVTGKPFIKEIPKSKFVFRSNLQSITTIARLHEILVQIIDPLIKQMEAPARESALSEESINSASAKLIEGNITLAKVIFDFAEKPKGGRKLKRMWHDFLNACLENIEYLYDIVNSFREYNQRFFFTLKYLRNFSLIQDAPYKPMDFNASSVESAENRIKRRSFLHLRGTKLLSQARQSHMN